SFTALTTPFTTPTFFFVRYPPNRDLHSFPTRRSSDLIVLTAICAGVAGTVDNFLRPILLSGRARLSGLLVFISVLGGVGVFGMLGIVLGPIVVATAVGILDAYTRHGNTVGEGGRAVLE